MVYSFVVVAHAYYLTGARHSPDISHHATSAHWYLVYTSMTYMYIYLYMYIYYVSAVAGRPCGQFNSGYPRMLLLTLVLEFESHRDFEFVCKNEKG